MKTSASYASFGERLVQLRTQVGISSQKEMAIAMGVQQQTISRWEKGSSRPREIELTKLAAVLSTDVQELKILSGYIAPSPVVLSFDQPFPIDSLTADSFERFSDFFISLLHPTAKVHRFGGTGSKQDGLDIEAILEDGSIRTYQCKRHKQFGPANVKAAIAAHTRRADKKVLLLTRIASPQARTIISAHKEWELWDKEDISKRIRQLPRAEQIRLVDIFFPGQRLALLGDTEAGPWMSIEDFFSAFLNKQRAFNHLWELVGREEEMLSLSKFIHEKAIRVVLLTGSGGLGKSRLLYQAITDYQSTKPAVLIKALSPTEELSTKHLESLGYGEKLLVIDDAHDREDLPLLFDYVANPKNCAKAILSLRSYGLQKVKLQAARLSLLDPRVAQVELKALKKEDSTKLALQVLKEYGGPESIAKEISRYTLDCPLATVIAAQIVAKGGIHLDLLNNEETFRTTLLAKFEEVITGEIADEKDSGTLRTILKLLALLQPFDPDDPELLALIERIEGISVSESNRLIKALVSGGVVFKRGFRYRLAPDLLADYIIEQNCVTPNGKSSGYAEKVFSECSPSMIENILLNLGRLDWRLSSGNTASSQLLDGLWKKLHPDGDLGHIHLQAIKSVSYYQPERALDFAEKSIADGKFFKELPELIKYAAYNSTHLARGCECLWELGRSDPREIHQHPHHAIRILKELCTVEPNKPLEFVEQVVDFGLSLLDLAETWTGIYTPYDFLKGTLETEGHITDSNGLEISFSPYLVRKNAITPIRTKIISFAVDRLASSQIEVALASAKILNNSLRYPMGLFGTSVSDSDYESWTDEFISTLELIKNKCATKSIDPFAWLELLRSISWHAIYAEGGTEKIANEIFDIAPTTIEFRLIRAIFDSYGSVNRAKEFEEKQQNWNRSIKDLARDIKSNYPSEDDTLQFLSAIVDKARALKLKEPASIEPILNALLIDNSAIARVLLESAITNPSYILSRYLSVALSHIYHNDLKEGRDFLDRLFKSENLESRLSAAALVGWMIKDPLENDFEINFVRKIIASSNNLEVSAASRTLRSIASVDPLIAIELICHSNLSDSDVSNEILAAFDDSNGIPTKLLSVEATNMLLEKLLLLPSIEGYWIQNFLADLSIHYPLETINFLKDRINHAVVTDEATYRPCNYGPYIHKPLRFKETAEYSSLLRDFWSWLKQEKTDDFNFTYYAYRLFSAIFYPIDSTVISFLREKFRGDSLDVLVIAKVLREVSSSFVLDNSEFIIEYLAAVRSHGAEHLDFAINSLYSAAVSGMREGMPGQPFPKDVSNLSKANVILSSLSRFSPAYKLYTYIKQDAERNIEQSNREREMFER